MSNYETPRRQRYANTITPMVKKFSEESAMDFEDDDDLLSNYNHKVLMNWLESFSKDEEFNKAVGKARFFDDACVINELNRDLSYEVCQRGINFYAKYCWEAPVTSK